MTARVSVVLLAAGYGTRLYPLTRDCPKALLPLGSHTILDPLVDDVQSLPGLSQVVLVTNARFFDRFEDWRRRRHLQIELVNDGTTEAERRLGAIQDLRLALSRIDPQDDVLVVGTDNLFTGSLKPFVAFAAAKRPSASVAIDEAGSLEEARHYGVLELDGAQRVVRLTEKPARPTSRHIGLCIYYFPAASRARVEEFVQGGGNVDAPGYFLEWLVRREAVYGYPLEGEWIDIGTSESYERAVVMWRAHAHSAAA